MSQTRLEIFFFILKFSNETPNSDVLEDSDNDLTHDPSGENHDWESPAWVAWSIPIINGFLFYSFISKSKLPLIQYYRNFNGDSLGQVEAVDVGDVAK